MATLTYSDIEKSGLELTKEEAMKLQSAVTHIAKFGSEKPVSVFNYDQTNPAATSGGGLSSVKQTEGFTPVPNKETKPETAKQKKDREKAEAEEAKRLAALKDSGLEERAITQEDLDDNPELVEEGKAVGDIHQFPIEAE